MEYCPNCIEKLQRQSKKLGPLKVWLVCPKCGFRTRELKWYEEKNDSERFSNYKKRTNGGNKFRG